MPDKTENGRFEGKKQASSKEYRPAGFGYNAVKKHTAEETDKAEENQKATRKRGLFAFLKPVKKKKRPVRKVRVKKVKKPKVKSKRRRIGRTELITIGIIVLILGIAATAVIVVNGSRSVHQMPVITRNTEEPTAEPVE